MRHQRCTGVLKNPVISRQADSTHGAKESKMKLVRVSVDLAKNVIQVHGLHRNEKSVWRRRLSRKQCMLGASRLRVED